VLAGGRRSGQLSIIGVATDSSYVLGGSDPSPASHRPWWLSSAPHVDVKITIVWSWIFRWIRRVSTDPTSSSSADTAAAYFRRLPMMSASCSLPVRAPGAAGSGLNVSKRVWAYKSRYFCAGTS
jgi:hypothetical protein